MRKTVLTLLLSSVVATWASAQQKPATPPARVLTPAEQRQKEKIERELQRERQIKAEWLQKQREYEAKQAEKERQRLAKKAAKEQPPVEKPQAAPTANPALSPTTPVANQPVEPAATTAEPTRKEKRERRKKEKTPEPTPTVTDAPATTPTVTTTPAPVETPAQPARTERPRRERKSQSQPVDSVAAAAGISSERVIVRPRHEFLPKGHLFEPILLDPLEAQTYGSVLPSYWTEGRKYKGSIVPFAFGFAKPFYRRTTESGRSEELVLDLVSFTQFEAYYDTKAGRARRQIMNNDYKISILYNIRRGANNYRFRVYHISSHLGDDYIYRNQITAPTPNSVNYELLDATYSRMANNWRLYGGLGIVLRKSEERKLLSAQLGTFYKKPSDKAARLVGGVDVKFWQQTSFRPGIHGGIGFEVGKTQNNLTFLLEGYSGFRPYSQFENQQTSWIGIGVYMNPF